MMSDQPAEHRLLTVAEYSEHMRPYDMAFWAVYDFYRLFPDGELSCEDVRSFVEAARDSLKSERDGMIPEPP